MHYGWGCLTNESSKLFIVIDENDHYPEPVTLMQYTGLEDKNGKEIYEGDVIIYTNPPPGHEVTKRNVVEWEAGSFILRVIGSDAASPFWLMKDYPNFEVIGNIYEDPDLLD